jgi:hypothetical protein
MSSPLHAVGLMTGRRMAMYLGSDPFSLVLALLMVVVWVALSIAALTL